MIVELTSDHKRRLAALAVPGTYWDRDSQTYRTDDPAPRTAAAIIALFPEALVAHPELTDIRDRDYGNARPHDFATELGISLDVGTLGPLTPYDWQDTDLGYLHAILKRDGGANIQWDRGLGKTLAAAAFVKKLDAQRTIVVARNDAKEPVWYKQLAVEATRGASEGLLPDHNVFVLPNLKAKREKFLARMEADELPRPWVLVIHYEAIALIAGEKRVKHDDGTESVTKGGGKGWRKVLPHGLDLLVYDEGHRLASYNPRSKRAPQSARALSGLRKLADAAINLTGSGIMNRPDDLYGQLHYLFPRIYRAKWADFNDRYIDYVDDGNHKVAIGFIAEKLPELRRELGVFTVYRRKDEVFDLPPLIHQDIELELLPEQRRAYDELLREFWTRLEEGGIKAANPMDHMHKLRRIATYWPGLPSAKLDFAVAELEETPDEQFAVFTWYKEPGHALAERFGDDVVVVDGDVSPKHRPELLRKHERGLARVLVGSIATLGESLNLQYMHEAIRLDRDWNPERNGQTIDRLNRNGQETRVTLRDLWALNTVDTLRVRPNLASKESLRKAVFG